MIKHINDKNNITVDDVKERIQRFDFRHWVSYGVLFNGQIDIMLNGSEIYERIFEPVVFDTRGQKRYNFLQRIGYFELMKVLRVQDVSDEEIEKISNELMNIIKENLEPIWIGNFDYPAPSPTHPLMRNRTDIILGWRSEARRQFREELEKRNLSCEEASEIIYKSTGKWNFALAKDISVKNISKASEKRNKRLHNQRLDVSRVILRSNLPSDLVPLVCAFVVPGSKKYKYMYY